MSIDAFEHLKEKLKLRHANFYSDHTKMRHQIKKYILIWNQVLQTSLIKLTSSSFIKTKTQGLEPKFSIPKLNITIGWARPSPADLVLKKKKQTKSYLNNYSAFKLVVCFLEHLEKHRKSRPWFLDFSKFF